MVFQLPDTYWQILESLKTKIRKARIKAVITANVHLLAVYWEIGQAIAEQEKAQGWGAKIVEQLARDLKTEFPDFKGLSARNLRYMRDFAQGWPELNVLQQAAATMDVSSILQQAAAKLPWFHICTLLDKLKNNEERRFYATKALQNGWSRSILIQQIESNLYKRQGKAINNFELTLPKPQSDLAKESLKNPYLFDFLGMGEEMQERELEKALIQHIKKFMLELGKGFAYVGNQFNVNVSGDDYFLDLLFYNYHLHCFVVFELKVGDFKPEFAGKLNFYINTVNEQIKTVEDRPTIGILLCRTPNETVVKYALQGIDAPIGVSEYQFNNDYQLTEAIPQNLQSELPTIEALEQEIEKEVIEYKENQNPIEVRLTALKEKIRGINSEEIQTPATFELLSKLYKEGLRPLYQRIIQQLSVFDEEFHGKSYGWSAKQFSSNKLEDVDKLWEDESRLQSIERQTFFYRLMGFKKAGTDNLNEHLELILEIREYWYGVIIIGNNDDKPFLKKLYHQPLSEVDLQMIIDLLMIKVMDRIDWILEFMKRNQDEKKV